MLSLRYYQREACDAVMSYWKNKGGNPLVDMATGTGKSLVIADLTKGLVERGCRVIQLVHVRELVAQNAQTMIRLWPQAPIGIYSAGLSRRDTNHRIIFASINSAYKRVELFGKRDVALIDECDLVPREGLGMYRMMIERLRQAVPDMRVVGFTATPYRLDSGRLDEGDDRIFDDTVYTYDIARGVNDGYLAPLRSRPGRGGIIDTSNLHVRGSEYIPSEVEAVANDEDTVAGACRELLKLGYDRGSWLVFCAGIKHAGNVLSKLKALGVACAMVTGETPSGDRDRTFENFKKGRIRALVGCQVFTTGFDAPNIDLIGLLTATLSTRLYVQMLGRGTRPMWPTGFDQNLATKEERIIAIAGSAKPNCLVLDFAGNVMEHGPVDAVNITAKEKRGDSSGEAPSKICPICDFYCPAAAHQCENCGYEWPVTEEPKHSINANIQAPVMTSEIVGEWLSVNDISYNVHYKNDTCSMVVAYDCGYPRYREWICFEHEGGARARAVGWWRAMGGMEPPPRTVNEAIERSDELELVTEIKVSRDGKWWKIEGYRIEKEDKILEIDRIFKKKIVEIADYQFPISLSEVNDDNIPF